MSHFQRLRLINPPGSGGGGGNPITPTVQWGPDFGGNNGDQFMVGVAVDFGDPALVANRTIGVAVDLDSIAMVTTRTVGISITGQALGAPFLQAVSTAETAESSTTLVINKPSGTIEGELMVAIVGSNTTSGTVTPPAGWTGIRTDAAGATIASFYKIATASEPSNYTFTLSASDAMIGQILRFNGIDSVTPVDVSGGQTGSATDPIAPSITTTVPNTHLIACCVQDNTLNADYTPPAGYTEQSDQNGLGLLGVLACTGETATRIQSATGASGTATMNSTQLVASNYAAQHIAIAPGPLTL